jgi:hypothetical protein
MEGAAAPSYSEQSDLTAQPIAAYVAPAKAALESNADDKRMTLPTPR